MRWTILFPSDDLWFGSDTNTIFEVIYNWHLDVKLFGVLFDAGKEMAYVGLPFLGTVCPVPDVGNVYLYNRLYNNISINYIIILIK